MGGLNKWSEETDIIVVGYGGAGAVTAITAHDAGAKVLILEKQPCDTISQTNHTPSTSMSGGGFLSSTDEGKVRLYLEALVKIANETLDSARQKALSSFAKYLMNNKMWLKSIGVETGDKDQMAPLYRGVPSDNPQFTPDGGILGADFPELDGADGICMYLPKPVDSYTHGAALFKALSNSIDARAIEVLWSTRGEHLVTENGRVRGIIASRSGKPISIKARKAMILTCGGFEFNDWLKENYLKVNPAYFVGNPANTGDGINMALEAGSALWHMNCASWRAVMKFPEFPIAFATAHHEEASIFVDKTGNRFANERYRMHAFGYQLTNYDDALYYPRVPFYWIFDEKRRVDGPLTSPHGACARVRGAIGSSYYMWSQDNLSEIDKGWVTKANTLDELARKLGKDADNGGRMRASNLKDSVKRFNLYCQNGEDPEFHRPKWTLTKVEDPPFYAVKLWPGGPNTQGGPRRNGRAQVLRPDNTPVPRLYSAGELGSVWGMFYQAGGNIAECIAFGRIAGTNAVAEKLW